MFLLLHLNSQSINLEKLLLEYSLEKNKDLLERELMISPLNLTIT